MTRKNTCLPTCESEFTTALFFSWQFWLTKRSVDFLKTRTIKKQLYHFKTRIKKIIIKSCLFFRPIAQMVDCIYLCENIAFSNLTGNHVS